MSDFVKKIFISFKKSLKIFLECGENDGIVVIIGGLEKCVVLLSIKYFFLIIVGK